MADQRKPDIRRGELSFIVAIVIGLALGIMVRRIKIGIIVGIVIGLLIILAGRRIGGNRH